MCMADAVYTFIHVFDDFNSVSSWSNEFLAVYTSMNENLEMLMKLGCKKNFKSMFGCQGKA